MCWLCVRLLVCDGEAVDAEEGANLSNARRPEMDVDDEDESKVRDGERVRRKRLTGEEGEGEKQSRESEERMRQDERTVPLCIAARLWIIPDPAVDDEREVGHEESVEEEEGIGILRHAADDQTRLKREQGKRRQRKRV